VVCVHTCVCGERERQRGNGLREREAGRERVKEIERESARAREGGRDGWREGRMEAMEGGRQKTSERERVPYKYSRDEYLGAFADSTGQSVLGNEQDGATTFIEQDGATTFIEQDGATTFIEQDGATTCNQKDLAATSLSLFCDEQEPHHAVTLFRYFGTKREKRGKGRGGIGGGGTGCG
jgi:hypothetical protein